MSHINAEIARRLENNNYRLVVADISPGGAHGVAYHALRMARVIAALGRIAHHASAPKRSLYAAVESGFGVLYTIAAVILARILRFRILLHYHSSRYVRRRRWLCFILVRAAGPEAQHVLASLAMAELFATLYKARRVRQVHNAAFVPVASPLATVPERPLTLGLLSNLTRAKGLDAALQTAIALARLGCCCRLVLAGPLIDDAAVASVAAARRELGDRLELRGAVAGVAKESFFTEIDVFLFATTYKYETQSLVVPEAMAHSVPVLAYAHAFIGELLDGGGGVLLTPGSDFVAGALPVLSAWANMPRLRIETGTKARERFLALHLEARTELDELLTDICEAGSAPKRSV